MRSGVRAFLTTALMSVAPLAIAQDAPEVWTLGAAFERAMENNPQIRSARERVQETEAGLRLAVSAIFPTITGASNLYTKQDASNSAAAFFGGQPYNIYQVTLTATQPLFDGLGFWNAWAAARKNVDLARLDLEVLERDLSLSLIQAFHTILLNQRRLGHLERNEQLLKEQLETTQRRLRIGRAQKIDVLQVQTQLALLAPQILAARNQAQVSAAQLLTLLGLGQSGGAQTVAVRGNLALPDWKAWVTAQQAPPLGDEQAPARPELRSNRTLQAQLQDKKGVALAPHLPQVSAIFAAGNQATARADLFNAYGIYWSVGLQISVPLFSGLSFWHTRSVYAAQAAQLEYQEQRLLNDQAFERLQARKNLDLAENQIIAADSAARLARESVTEAQRNYKVATIDTVQLLQTQTSLLQAEISLDQARLDAMVALARMGVAQGWSLAPLLRWIAASTGEG